MQAELCVRENILVEEGGLSRASALRVGESEFGYASPSFQRVKVGNFGSRIGRH